jgi:hypothetical protein
MCCCKSCLVIKYLSHKEQYFTTKSRSMTVSSKTEGIIELLCVECGDAGWLIIECCQFIARVQHDDVDDGPYSNPIMTKEKVRPKTPNCMVVDNDVTVGFQGSYPTADYGPFVSYIWLH